VSTAEAPRITREDIETKLRQLKGDAEEVTNAQKTNGIIIAAVGGVLVLALAYFLGRRRGRKKSAFVEIRRL
jgi:LPXTG-motif cell wall-anchored protein